MLTALLGALDRNSRQMRYENTVWLAFSGPRNEAGPSDAGSLRSGLRRTLLTRSLSGQHRQFEQFGDNYQRRIRSPGMAAHVHNSDLFSGSRLPFARQRSGVFVHSTRFAGPALVPQNTADSLVRISRRHLYENQRLPRALRVCGLCPVVVVVPRAGGRSLCLVSPQRIQVAVRIPSQACRRTVDCCCFRRPACRIQQKMKWRFAAPSRRWRRTAAPPLRSMRGEDLRVSFTLRLAISAAVA